MSANDDLFVISEPPAAKQQPSKRPLLIGAAVVLAIALAGAGFLIGRSTANSGPRTLAAAVQQASSGKLPCGNTSTGQAAFLSRLCSGNNSGNGEFPRRGGFGNGQNGGAPGGTGAGAINGTVASISASALTIQTRAGQLKIALPGNVQVRTTRASNKSAITSGATVSVTTTTDSSGNRVASRIVVLPAS